MSVTPRLRASQPVLIAVVLAGTGAGLAVEAHAQEIVSVDYIVRVDTTALPVRIAFGSCSEEDKPQPVLDLVVARRPDLFIYLGDNIYGDSRSMDTIRAKYGRLAARSEFQRLRAATTVLATWDDHDYGWNDTGRHFPFKAESKQIFLDFWGEPDSSDRRRHEGIYTAHRFQLNGKRLQIILLDTRTFRDDLVRSDDVAPHKNDYQPNPSSDSTILGAAQWQWLEAQLRVPADLRVIASSIQFSHEYNGWESWTNVPHERQRMIELIRSTGAEGVLFISGDVHWGEISRQDVPGLYPLWDVTSSGITETWPSVEPNSNRVGEVVRENNFGEIEIDWSGEEPHIALRLFDVTGALRNEVRLEKPAISR
ncbi:MAG: alkaline phosphatase D family protein [Longimicrobiales bacterium]